MNAFRAIGGILKGMSVTLREMFSPTVVENYPDGPGPLRGAKFEARFRGLHVLQRDENGLEKCVACFLCAAACLSNCIYIEAAENTEEHCFSPVPLRRWRDHPGSARIAWSAIIGSRQSRPVSQ